MMKPLQKKLRNWTNKTSVIVTGQRKQEGFLRQKRDKRDDKPIQLPLITLRRAGDVFIDIAGKKTLTYDGLVLSATNTKSTSLNAIPIDITYQIDIYCRYYKEADEYVRNLVFNITNYPKFQINIPYEGLNLTHNANLILMPNIIDGSNVPERLIAGQFTRMALGVQVKDAYLFDVRTLDNYSIANINVDGNNTL